MGKHQHFSRQQQAEYIYLGGVVKNLTRHFVSPETSTVTRNKFRSYLFRWMMGRRVDGWEAGREGTRREATPNKRASAGGEWIHFFILSHKRNGFLFILARFVSFVWF